MENATALDYHQLPKVFLHPWLVEPDLDGGSPPSALGNIVIEHMHRFRNGSPPSLVTRERVIASSLTDYVRRQLWSIEEHCHRHRNDRRARHALKRIGEIFRGYDCSSLARRLVRNVPDAPRTSRSRKRKGLDVGPPL